MKFQREEVHLLLALEVLGHLGYGVVEGVGILLLCGNTWLNKAIHIMARKKRVQALSVNELKPPLGLLP